MALLPPRPNVKEALKILGLPKGDKGIRQLYQHIAYDGLPAYFKGTLEAIKFDDNRVSYYDGLLGGKSVSVDPPIDIKKPIKEQGVYRVVGDMRIANSNISVDWDSKESCLMVESFILDDEHYRPLKIVVESVYNDEDEPLFNEEGEQVRAITGYRLQPKKITIKAIYFLREDLLNFLGAADYVNNKVNIENHDRNVMTKLNDRGLSVFATRERVFKFWVAGKGGESVVVPLQKKEVWGLLQEIDRQLFATGMDDFFSDQTVVKFLAGRRKKAD